MERYTVEWLQRGQPHPHADGIYEAIITVEHQTEKSQGFVSRPTNKDFARQLAKSLVRDFPDTPRMFSSFLDNLVEIESGKWKVKIVQPSTD